MSEQRDDLSPLETLVQEVRRRVVAPADRPIRLHLWDAAEALSSAEIRASFDRLSDGIWECNFATRELRVSPRWLSSLGFQPGDISPDLSAVRQLFHPEDYPEALEALRAHLNEEREIFYVEVRILTKSGSWKPIACRGQVVERDESGKAVRVFGVNHDVSAQKTAEEALRKSEEKFAKAFDANPEIVVLSRLSDGVILECNSSALRKGNLKREDLIGKSVVELGLYANASDREEDMRLLQEADGFAEREIQIRHPTGSMHTVIVAARNIEVGGEPCVLTVARDVTEQRELEEQLRQAQKMEAVGQLAGGIAHDFNNLLVVISGYGESLLEQLEPGSELSEAAGEIVRAASRAASLTHQLLAFGRRQSLQPRILDLNEVVRDTESLLRRLIGEEIALSLRLEPQLGLVTADPGQIQQMLLNLAVNARDAMPEGGPLVIQTRNLSPREARRVRGIELAAAEYVCMSVTDAGVGIPTGAEDQIFEPFFTTKEPGHGTGLGLSTVYGIAKQSGGDIRVESKPGEGTTFEIFFPGAIGERVTTDSVEAIQQAPEFEGRTILVVEDEASVRRLVRVVLERSGFKVLEATNGRSALALTAEQTEPIDLVLTDVRMPEMGGLELSQRLREARPETRVIFMSGYASPSASEQALMREAGEVLLKPFSPPELLARLREALR
jgi:PAS domain S-box-containing protein